ncbi:hypothetical protein P3S68_006034 [Capsicum galapagoense]
MGRQRVKADYEELRKAQILENHSRGITVQARFANLGLHKIIGDLRTKSKSVKKKNNNKVNYFSAPLRRSNRLQENSALPAINGDVEDDIKKKPDNVLPFLSLKHGFKANLSPEALARRCTRLKVGVICHCCSEKKLCGEEDCKRCGDFDVDQPCLGKTECSICHSSNGVLCRRCLDAIWALCLKMRNIAPAGSSVISKVRKMGYKSVAHLLMAELQGVVKWR